MTTRRMRATCGSSGLSVDRVQSSDAEQASAVAEEVGNSLDLSAHTCAVV